MMQYQILDISRNKYRKMSKTNNMNNFMKRINKISPQKKKEIQIRNVDVNLVKSKRFSINKDQIIKMNRIKYSKQQLIKKWVLNKTTLQ